MTALKQYNERKISKRSAQGFTLIELLVVIVLLGLLAGLVVPNLMGKTEAAKSKAAGNQIQLLSSMITEYYLENGQPPENLSDLVPDYAKAAQIKDPWGRDYHYEYPGQNADFDIYTYGADNSPGGEGKNQDVNNWD